MKQLLTSFAAYDLWANEKLMASILALTNEQQQQDIISSFPSLYRTSLHMWDAAGIWWQRLEMLEEIVVPSLSFHPSMNDVTAGLLAQNKQWKEWVAAATDVDLGKELYYKNSRGEAFRQPVQEILLHLFNHGTYHRGQLVTMLRQLGAEQVPPTDYIIFSRCD